MYIGSILYIYTTYTYYLPIYLSIYLYIWSNYNHQSINQLIIHHRLHRTSRFKNIYEQYTLHDTEFLCPITTNNFCARGEYMMFWGKSAKEVCTVETGKVCSPWRLMPYLFTNTIF